MSSTDDSSSDSDDEMRLRLMETVVTVDQINNEKQKGTGSSSTNQITQIVSYKVVWNSCYESFYKLYVILYIDYKSYKEKNLIKVGPYGDIELSQGQINRLVNILR